MTDADVVAFLQWALPTLRMRWPGFRKVRGQVRKRLARRLRELDLETLRDYEAHLEAHPEEWATLDGFCRITISRFYRDRGVFDTLRDRVLPDLGSIAEARRASVIRAWSAGCASGEEPYSLSLAWELGTRRRRCPKARSISCCVAISYSPTSRCRSRKRGSRRCWTCSHPMACSFSVRTSASRPGNGLWTALTGPSRSSVSGRDGHRRKARLRRAPHRQALRSGGAARPNAG
jgi:hypothetical protein